MLLFSRKDTLSGSKFIQQIWLETIMQHQVHVLSVFDGISFKYWLFVPQTGLTQRQDNSVLPLQVIVLLNSFCSTITTQIWLFNARSIVGPLNWWLTVDLYFNKNLSLKDVTWNNKIIIISGSEKAVEIPRQE